MAAHIARFYLLGDRAAVIESPPPISAICQQKIGWVARKLANHPAVLEVVPGMNNLTVVLNTATRVNPNHFLSELETFWSNAEEETVATSRTLSIPVEYGGRFGSDLKKVALHTGLSTDQVIMLHAKANYLVYFLGFQPGFAYMGGLPESLATPRLAEPRLAVPAGSVGIGGSQTGIYPSTSPGGWNIIGRTTLTLFDPLANPPTLLQPGDQVRFIPMESNA